MIRDRDCRWFSLPRWGWVLLVSAMFSGSVGCGDFEPEVLSNCEWNQDDPACGVTSTPQPAAQPPEIVASSQKLLLPEGGIFSFGVEAHDPQNSPLHFSWTASGGAFASPQMDTHSTSEISWLTPPCSVEVDPPLITVTVTNELGLSVSAHFKVTYAMLCGNWEGGKVTIGRTGHTLSLLNSGQVLVAGGIGAQGYVPGTELLDPKDFSTSPSGALRTPRAMHTATMLASGRVLVAGGFSESGYLKSAELYIPETGEWLPTADMSTPRALHTAALLSSGEVLVVGGLGPYGSVSSAEIYTYDPRTDTGTWTPVPGVMTLCPGRLCR